MNKKKLEEIKYLDFKISTLESHINHIEKEDTYLVNCGFRSTKSRYLEECYRDITDEIKTIVLVKLKKKLAQLKQQFEEM